MTSTFTIIASGPKGAKVRTMRGTHAKVMAYARRTATRTGVAVKVTSTEGKWIALGGEASKRLPWSAYRQRTADRERASLASTIDWYLREDAKHAANGTREHADWEKAA